MDRPESLVGHAVGGTRICKDWELRVTARCLDEDLNADPESAFKSIEGLEIIKAFVKDRAETYKASKKISPLSSGEDVYRLAYGHDHRGGTYYEADEGVVWLVAYGRHRSGTPDDFFPYCKQLDAEDRLLPVEADLARMYRDRDRRFVDAVTVEAPLILKKARETNGEYTCTVGGKLGASVTIEVVEELEMSSITIAMEPADDNPFSRVTLEQAQVLLVALVSGKWTEATRMPSRELTDDEVAYTIDLVAGKGA